MCMIAFHVSESRIKKLKMIALPNLLKANLNMKFYAHFTRLIFVFRIECFSSCYIVILEIVYRNPKSNT